MEDGLREEVLATRGGRRDGRFLAGHGDAEKTGDRLQVGLGRGLVEGDADAVLVVGSSLTVHSGLRYVRRAVSDGLPVVIVNRGATRGDALAVVKVDAGVSETLEGLEKALVGKG